LEALFKWFDYHYNINDINVKEKIKNEQVENAMKLMEERCGNIFDALKHKVYEETGLNVTRIYGEEKCTNEQTAGVNTISFNPFCVTQNLDGIYSIIMTTFICNVEGEPVENTDETTNIRWEKLEKIEEIIDNSPEKIFQMDVLPFKEYIRLMS
jgi:hypothetical protein